MVLRVASGAASDTSTLVVGPASATADGLAIFDGTTGKLLKDSSGFSAGSGHLLAKTDNTYDIGASAATRPRFGYFATGLVSGPLAINVNVTTISGSVAPVYLSVDGNANAGWAAASYGNNAYGAEFQFFKTRSTSTAANVIVQSGDRIFALGGYGADSGTYRQAGLIQLIVDGTPGTGDMPGRWEFYTTPDGSATPALALTIKNTKAILAAASVTAHNATAIPAGGTAGAGLLVSSTANFGVFFGSGAPTLAAAKGSLYLRSDGSGVADRAYINTDGSTAWAAVATAS